MHVEFVHGSQINGKFLTSGLTKGRGSTNSVSAVRERDRESKDQKQAGKIGTSGSSVKVGLRVGIWWIELVTDGE